MRLAGYGNKCYKFLMHFQCELSVWQSTIGEKERERGESKRKVDWLLAKSICISLRGILKNICVCLYKLGKLNFSSHATWPKYRIKQQQQPEKQKQQRKSREICLGIGRYCKGTAAGNGFRTHVTMCENVLKIRDCIQIWCEWEVEGYIDTGEKEGAACADNYRSYWNKNLSKNKYLAFEVNRLKIESTFAQCAMNKFVNVWLKINDFH